MAVATTTAIAIAGLSLAAAGTAVTVSGQAQASSAQQKAEQIRKRAANLDLMRKKREAIRNAQFAAAQSQVVATNQGAQFGSVLPQAEAGIQSQLNYNEKGLSQDRDIGNRLATQNSKIAQGQGTASIGQSVASLGGQMVNNADTIGRVGTYATTEKQPV